MTEPAAARLSHLRGFAPLLDAWVNTGLLPDAEADLVLLASEATRMRSPLSIALPGGSSALAAAVALHSAVEAAVHPGRYPAGPTALITNSVKRNASLAMNVDDIPVAISLGAVRLRADGQAQAISGNRISALSTCQRLLYVSPRARWPDINITLGVAVLDQRALGQAFERAYQWAQRWAQIVHVISELDPSGAPSSFEVDWPLVATDPQRWNRSTSWPVLGEVRLEVTQSDPNGLVRSRERIASAPRTNQAWPAPLAAAASLSRTLASVAVPLGLYDASTVGTIASSLAERIDYLASTRSRDFSSEWSAFAESDWATIKRGLLDAAADIEEHNTKAEQVGISIEGLLAEGRDVDVWVGSNVHGRALQTHLLSAGFGLGPDDFNNCRVTIRTLSEAPNKPAASRAGLLTGLPTTWQLSAISAGGVGGPLVVLAYPFEAEQAARRFGWMLNCGRLARNERRTEVLTTSLGLGVSPDMAPEPVRLEIRRSDAVGTKAGHIREYSEDAAEFAALADDDWLSLAAQDEAQPDTDDGIARSAIAFLVNPGPEVLLLGEHTIVDRLVAGRLRTVPAISLEPPMQVLGTKASGSVFAAIRPHLDNLRGLGTRFWLDQWEDALRSALSVAGAPSALAERLVSAGAAISAAAVASWVSPYRIGPRDPKNVRRVAEVADHPVVLHHHTRVHAVMRGVRTEHGLLGRQLAVALRLHVQGDASAFDEIEDRLGAEIETMLGDLAIHEIVKKLASGMAPASALGRTHSIAAAQRLFHTREQG